jgi:hypothetical protein
MKKTLLFSLVISFSLLISACNNQGSTTESNTDTDETNSTSSSSSENNDLKRYAVKAGSVTYTLSGSQTGTKTITWKDWGMTEKTINNTSISAGGISIPNKDINYMIGDFMYNYTPGESSGTKIKNTILEQISQNTNKELEEIGLDLLKAMGAKKTGTDSIAGETCDVYEIKNLGTTTCVWKAINLKNESSIAGITISEIANSISTDTPADSTFELPSNVTFKDLGDISDILKNF